MSDLQQNHAAPSNSRWAEIRSTLSLAGPMVMTMVAVILMETVDTLMIGRLGEVALAAAALALQCWFMLLLFGMGVLGAVSSLTSQAVAKDDVKAVRRSARQGLWIGLMLGGPFALILTQADDMLLAIGQDPDVVAGAQEYLNWIGPALIVIFLNIPIRLTMASYGVTLPPMLFVWAALPLNALLNWVFMYGGLGGPEMGLPGAGVATLIVDILILGSSVCYILWAPLFRKLDLFARFWRPDWPRFKQLLAIGVPTGVSLFFEHGLFAASAIMMGWIGVTQLAAHQIATQIVAITFMVPFGLSQAATIRIGLAAGARDLAAIRLRGWTIFQMTAIFMLASAIVFWLFGRELSGMFIAEADPARAALINYGALFLAIAAFFQLVDGLQASGGGILRGVNDTMIPMVLALIGYWGLGVPCACILGFALGFEGAGIWYGMAVGLTFCAFGALGRFWWLTRIPTRTFWRIRDTELGEESGRDA